MALIPCLEVDNIQFNWNAGSGVLTVYWTSPGTSFKLRWRHAQESFTGYVTTAALSYAISGLTPGNQYQFEVVRVCGVGYESIESSMSYVIAAPGVGPSNLQIVSYSDTQIAITWDGPAVTYLVSWVEQAESGDPDNVEYAQVTGNAYTITGLDGDKRYKVGVTRMIGDYPIFADTYIDKSKVCCVQASNVN